MFVVTAAPAGMSRLPARDGLRTRGGLSACA